MASDLISVVLPVHNAEDTLVACLDSVLNQSLAEFELVAVDDGSTDKTHEILRTYQNQDPRIRVVSLFENQGIVTALNCGIEEARGRWIARMDADDLMRKERLEIQLRYMQDFPDTDLAGALVRIFKDEGRLSPGQEKYRDWSNSLTEHHSICREIFVESPVMHPTFFFQKDLWAELGGYRDEPWAEDYDFILRCYESKKRFGKVDQILVDKRNLPTRLSFNDMRYKRKAMFGAKAHYFVRSHPDAAKKNLVIVGSGNSGRHLFRALRSMGLQTAEFLDDGPTDPNRKILGVAAQNMVDAFASRKKGWSSGSFFLVCVGDEAGLQEVERIFDNNGLENQRDYLRFI